MLQIIIQGLKRIESKVILNKNVDTNITNYTLTQLKYTYLKLLYVTFSLRNFPVKHQL